MVWPGQKPSTLISVMIDDLDHDLAGFGFIKRATDCRVGMA
jgi:hypothetical protein